MFNHSSLFNKVESILLKICFISLILLLILQGVLNNEKLSVFFDGTASADIFSIENLNSQEKGIIIVKIEGNGVYKNTEILINGEIVSNFNKKDELKLYVYNNDIIEVNGAMYDKDIKIKLIGKSKNVESPKLDSFAITRRNIEILGKVVLN